MRYFILRLEDGTAATIARVDGTTAADRFIRDATAWEPFPSLVRLAVWEPDMAWDEVDAAEAAQFLAELGTVVALDAASA